MFLEILYLFLNSLITLTEINEDYTILAVAKRLGYRVQFIANPKLLEEKKKKSYDLVKR